MPWPLRIGSSPAAISYDAKRSQISLPVNLVHSEVSCSWSWSVTNDARTRAAPFRLSCPNAQSIAVDLSAQIADGEAANWFVDMYDFIEANAWVPIGDLSTAGTSSRQFLLH